jgi:hypothetical protein
MSDESSSLRGRELSTTADNIRAVGGTILARADGSRVTLSHSAKILRLAMPSQPACDRVREAVVNAAARDAESMELLRASVGHFTTEMRGAGATPEAVLISLKALVNAGVGPVISHTLDDWSGYILRDKMSTWCIDEYFSDERVASPVPAK